MKILAQGDRLVGPEERRPHTPHRMGELVQQLRQMGRGRPTASVENREITCRVEAARSAESVVATDRGLFSLSIHQRFRVFFCWSVPWGVFLCNQKMRHPWFKAGER